MLGDLLPVMPVLGLTVSRLVMISTSIMRGRDSYTGQAKTCGEEKRRCCCEWSLHLVPFSGGCGC